MFWRVEVVVGASPRVSSGFSGADAWTWCGMLGEGGSMLGEGMEQVAFGSGESVCLRNGGEGVLACAGKGAGGCLVKSCGSRVLGHTMCGRAGSPWRRLSQCAL